MKKTPLEPAAVRSQSVEDRHARSRRRLLQSLAVGGAAVTVKAVPEQWAKPALDVSILPVHAQATCQANSLNCTVTDIDFDGSADGPESVSSSPPLVGGNNDSVDSTIGRIADPGGTPCGGTWVGDSVAGISFGVSATIDPPCAPVRLTASLESNNNTVFSLDSGQSQNGVVDPISGAVAFNLVNVGFDLNGHTVDGTENFSATLDIRVQSSGLPDCVIDIAFNENLHCTE